MGIFKKFTKILKKAAPIIGGSIGFAIGGPLGSAAIGSALGAGIGSLAAGADTDDALKAALLGGIGGYAASGGKLFTAAAPSAAAASGTQAVTDSVVAGGIDSAAPGLASSSIPKFVPPKDPSFFSKALDFAKTPTGIATIGGIGTLAALGEEPKQEFARQPDPVGKTRLGLGFIDGKSYDLDDDEERKEYFKDLEERRAVKKRLGGMADFQRLNNIQLGLVRDRDDFTEEEKRMAEGILATRSQPLPFTSFGNVPDGMMNGGEVNGPGTGTSDSVPARLSDGEFVLTAKAVRGAGGGDRDIGAARMYEMMSELERVA